MTLGLSLLGEMARRRADPTLELTPLIDGVFLLLLFFLITTTFARPQESQLPLNLPSAAAGESTTPGERVVIFVTADGSLQLQDELVRPDEVRARGFTTPARHVFERLAE